MVAIINIDTIDKLLDENNLEAVKNILLKKYAPPQQYCLKNRSAQTTIEAFFVNDPSQFFALFCKFKEKKQSDFFIEILNETNLKFLTAKWHAEKLKAVQSSIEKFKEHKNKLSGMADQQYFQSASRLYIALDLVLSRRLTPVKQSNSNNSSPAESPSRVARETQNLSFHEISPDINLIIEFAAKLHENARQFDKHHDYWKVICANILLGVLGVGILYGLAIVYKSVKAGTPTLFFSDTERKKRFKEIEFAAFGKEKSSMLYTA